MTLHILHPGQFTTVQDLGRTARRALGYPTGGAVDTVAATLANLLVANPASAAVLECALAGPELRFSTDTTVALVGASAPDLPNGSSRHLPRGQSLSLRKLTGGAFPCLAIAGGIAVPQVLGSRATDLRLALGGHLGRPLRTGDRLPCFPPSANPPPPRRINLADLYPPDAPIRYIPSSDFDTGWSAHPYTVSPRSDRTGLRLLGPSVPAPQLPDRPSSPVFPGTLQLPGDGQPILLLADAQTLGGYPVLGHVIRADLHRAAQLRPGSTVQFTPVDWSHARDAYDQLARTLALLRLGLSHT
jgi:5-oxoprolinase (ATP-hydrolysing) subunit C